MLAARVGLGAEAGHAHVEAGDDRLGHHVRPNLAQADRGDEPRIAQLSDQLDVQQRVD